MDLTIFQREKNPNSILPHHGLARERGGRLFDNELKLD